MSYRLEYKMYNEQLSEEFINIKNKKIAKEKAIKLSFDSGKDIIIFDNKINHKIAEVSHVDLLTF